MAIHRFWRKARMKAARWRRAAPLLPDTTGLSGTARRVNRVVAVVALFGAFGTVALAVALTPEGQTSASIAPAPQEDFKISRIEVPPAPAPAPVAAASLNTTVVVVTPPPEPAPKADRLFRTPRAPEDRNGQSPAAPGVTDTEVAGERDLAMADMPEPKAAREAAESAGRKLDEDAGRNLEFGLSEPPEPGESGDAAVEDAAVDDATLDDIEDIVEAAVDETSDEVVDEAAIEEPADEPVEEEAEVAEPAAPEPAAPEPAEVAATRTAPVTTDVNMRSRPSNGAAVIQVVPGRSTVEVIGCDYWCEVVYKGRRGWIYKGFVRGS